eukprot:PhF_6_TR12601/c0_g1_i2/m.19868
MGVFDLCNGLFLILPLSMCCGIYLVLTSNPPPCSSIPPSQRVKYCHEPLAPYGQSIRFELFTTPLMNDALTHRHTPFHKEILKVPMWNSTDTTSADGSLFSIVLNTTNPFPMELRSRHREPRHHSLYLRTRVVIESSNPDDVIAFELQPLPLAIKCRTSKSLNSPNTSGVCWRPKASIVVVATNAPMVSHPQPYPLVIDTHRRLSEPLRREGYLPLAMWDDDVTNYHYSPLSTNMSRGVPTFTFRVEFVTYGMFLLKKYIQLIMKQYREMNIPEDLLDMIVYELQPHRIRAFLVNTVASQLHTFFAMLAFKNDIAFYMKKGSKRGLSVTSLAASAVQTLITFLYLADHESIPNFILGVHGLSAALSFWKVFRVLIDRRQRSSSNDNAAPTDPEDVDPTEKYDRIALKGVGSICGLLF